MIEAICDGIAHDHGDLGVGHGMASWASVTGWRARYRSRGGELGVVHGMGSVRARAEVAAAVVATAQDLVTNLRGAGVVSGVADDDLLTLPRHDPTHDAGVELTLPAAPAEHLDLQSRHL